MDLIKALNKEQLEKEVPQVQVGDTVDSTEWCSRHPRPPKKTT